MSVEVVKDRSYFVFNAARDWEPVWCRKLCWERNRNRKNHRDGSGSKERGKSRNGAKGHKELIEKGSESKSNLE